MREGRSGRARAAGRWAAVALGLAWGCSDGTGPDAEGVGVWRALAVGESHACAADERGNVFCWGANDRGQLSAAAGAMTSVPALSQIGSDAAALGAGSGYSCLLSTAGNATCWGDGSVGQLGNGSAFPSPIGVPVLGGPWSVLSTGAHHLCGIDAGSVRCWGGDRYGASLGTRLPIQSRCTEARGLEMWWCQLEPGALDEAGVFAQVSAGLWHSCGLDGAGVVHCWGQNSLGQLGATPEDECVVPDPVHGDAFFPCNFDPRPVALPAPARSVTAGASHTCAVLIDDSAYCWGGIALYAGQLGHGGSDGSTEPVRVAGDEPFQALSLNRQSIWTQTCGLTLAGRILCWGSNSRGQLGASATESCVPGGGSPCSLVPVAVETEERFQSVAVGEQFVCGLTPDGRVLCWGLNDRGQLGDGTFDSRQEPREIVAVGQSSF